MDLDFYTLERPVQDRFADATRDVGVPTPILRESHRDRRALLWMGLAGLFGFGLVWLVSHGFGDLSNAVAIAPPWMMGAYGVAVAAAVFAILRALSVQYARSKLPYEPGLYLFPVGIVDARSEPFRVFRHAELGDLAFSGDRVRVPVKGHGAFSFRVSDPKLGDQIRAALEEGRIQYERALETANARDLALVDPLVDSGFSSPFSSRAVIRRRKPLWATLAPLAALGAGALLGPALWKGRNIASERRLYAEAVRRNDVPGYRSYIARGGPRPEVAEILLPRAELAEAVRDDGVDAIERFVAAHPHTRIQAEVDVALRTALNAELVHAEEAGTVTALRTFETRRSAYPFMRPAADQAIAALYKKALAAFSAGKDDAVAAFFARLLGYSRVHGPHATIQFVRRIPDSVDRADQQVRASAYFMGKQSIPSQYFVGDYALRRETAAEATLSKELKDPFPADVLDVEPGPTITDPGPIPAPTEPTLFVEYSPDMAGGYMSPKPRGVFVGVGLTFKASFVVPEDGEPLEYKYSLWRVPNAKILEQEGTTVADVYEKMASDAFDRFVKGFLATIFPAKS